ncbi:MAG: hypothetical protein D6826_00415 [Alphaproteobacteria bacterium]|nr:MAG: hypothetical protein D6826_00415 [Alphaproteobacteria bacterium]
MRASEPTSIRTGNARSVIELDIAEILPSFPDVRIALVATGELDLSSPRPAALDAALDEVVETAAAALDGCALAELPALRTWRAAYKAFGVRKTSYRSSVERLLKQVRQGRGLPRVHVLVDCYNAVSIRHRVPVGADDLARVRPPLAFRHARPGDTFFALGDPAARNDPPKPGEVVYADAEKVLCRRWNWYQDARSAITPATRRAVLTVQSLGGGTDPEEAVADLARWLRDWCGAATAWAIAEAATPRVRVDPP